MRKLIRKTIFEELESMFNSDGEIEFDMDSDETPDAEEIQSSLETDVEGMEDMVTNKKKTINFPSSIDPKIANKEKQIKRDQVSDLEDRIQKKKEDIEKMKGIQSGMQQMADAMAAAKNSQDELPVPPEESLGV